MNNKDKESLQMTEIIVLYIMNDVYEVCIFKNKTLLAFEEVDIRIKNTFRVKVCGLWAKF